MKLKVIVLGSVCSFTYIQPIIPQSHESNAAAEELPCLFNASELTVIGREGGKAWKECFRYFNFNNKVLTPAKAEAGIGRARLCFRPEERWQEMGSRGDQKSGQKENIGVTSFCQDS